MDTALIGVIAGQAGSVIGGIVWAVRQAGRIDGHDIRFQAAEKLAEVRQTNVENALQRIETKLDRKAIVEA